MTVTAANVQAPVDYVLLEFPEDRLTGDTAAALAGLVEAGTIRLYDLAVIAKHQDGSCEVLEVDDVAAIPGLQAFSGARSGLLSADDIALAAEVMEPGKVAAFILYENTWAASFVAAARASGGELIASERIPTPDVAAALEALESED